MKVQPKEHKVRPCANGCKHGKFNTVYKPRIPCVRTALDSSTVTVVTSYLADTSTADEQRQPKEVPRHGMRRENRITAQFRWLAIRGAS